MKILILGSSGFLGSYLFKHLKNCGHRVSSIKRDLWVEESGAFKNNLMLDSIFSKNDIVINCIAETDFNKCDSFLGLEANVGIPEKIAYFISKHNIYCIHISTDAVYDSKGNNSDEDSSLRINNSYATQKRKAEIVLQQTNSLILRTSFLGKNPREIGMIDYLIDCIKKQKIIYGWNDVYTSSVHISDISSVIDILIENPITGLFNYGTSKPYSKFDLLNRIMEKLDYQIIVSSIKAPLDHKSRNLNCGMLSKKIKERLALKLPTFDTVVENCLNDIKINL